MFFPDCLSPLLTIATVGSHYHFAAPTGLFRRVFFASPSLFFASPSPLLSFSPLAMMASLLLLPMNPNVAALLEDVGFRVYWFVCVWCDFYEFTFFFF